MRGMMSEFNLTARGPNTTHRSSAIYSRTIRHAGYTSSQRGSTNGKRDLRRVKWIKTVESMRNTRHRCGPEVYLHSRGLPLGAIRNRGAAESYGKRRSGVEKP